MIENMLKRSQEFFPMGSLVHLISLCLFICLFVSFHCPLIALHLPFCFFTLPLPLKDYSQDMDVLLLAKPVGQVPWRLRQCGRTMWGVELNVDMTKTTAMWQDMITENEVEEVEDFDATKRLDSDPSAGRCFSLLQPLVHHRSFQKNREAVAYNLRQHCGITVAERFMERRLLVTIAENCFGEDASPPLQGRALMDAISVVLENATVVPEISDCAKGVSATSFCNLFLQARNVYHVVSVLFGEAWQML